MISSEWSGDQILDISSQDDLGAAIEKIVQSHLWSLRDECVAFEKRLQEEGTWVEYLDPNEVYERAMSMASQIIRGYMSG